MYLIILSIVLASVALYQSVIAFSLKEKKKELELKLNLKDVMLSEKTKELAMYSSEVINLRKMVRDRDIQIAKTGLTRDEKGRIRKA